MEKETTNLISWPTANMFLPTGRFLVIRLAMGNNTPRGEAQPSLKKYLRPSQGAVHWLSLLEKTLTSERRFPHCSQGVSAVTCNYSLTIPNCISDAM